MYGQAEHPPAAHACALRFEESLAHALAESLRRVQPSRRDADVRAHLIVQATESLAHRFAVGGIHDLPRAAFTAELTHLLLGYALASRAR